jgi:hypothetical protein
MTLNRYPGVSPYPPDVTIRYLEESSRDHPVKDWLQPMDRGTEDEFEDDYDWVFSVIT